MSDGNRQKRSRAEEDSDINNTNPNSSAKRKRSDAVDNAAGQKASSVTPNNSDGAANSACSNAKATDNAPSHNKAMWIFTEEELQNSPSRKCGIAVEAENLHRKKAVKYIRTIGQRLNLRQHVEISTAIVFFYRFFTRQSFSEHGHYVVALACIFLATKVESGVKGRADDLILADYSLRRKKKYESMKNLINKLRHKKKPRHDDPALKEYWEQKDQLHIYERILLMTLSFDVNVTHPYKLVMYKVKSIISSNMKNNPSHGHTRQHKAHMKQMAKFSWNFVNDSFKTPICLLYAAPKIAAACMFLSFRLQKRHGANIALTEEGLMQTLVKNEITRHDIFAIGWID